MGPRLAIVNPLRWEVGHVAFFQEYWMLRHARQQPPVLSNGDALYDSARVAHDTRWDLPLPSKKETIDYMQQTLHRVINRVQDASGSAGTSDRCDEAYFLHLVLFHEYMHSEAITYTRQTLCYAPPRISIAEVGVRSSSGASGKQARERWSAENLGDVEVPGGRFLFGSSPDSSFVFDNEQWAHPVGIQPFSISRAAVTNAQFADFIVEGGYKRRELWSDEGRRWREQVGAAALMFGTVMKGDSPTVAHNVSYALVNSALLWLAGYYGYSLDQLSPRGRAEYE